MRVLICAGGTGGHIYPALAAVTELCRLGVEAADLLWIGVRDQMEETLVSRAKLNLATISGGGLVGKAPHIVVVNVLKLLWGFVMAFRLIRQFKPNVMFMTGGYVAPPVSLACWLQRIPIVIYLPDVEPGRSIRMALPLAQKIACTSEGSSAYVSAEKMVVTGYPVRSELRDANQMSQAEALAKFSLQPVRPTVFVFGGSRGAWHINKALMAILPTLLQVAQVIHISGTLTWPDVEANAQVLPDNLCTFYRPYPYLHEEMGVAYRAADLVVARAGASMLGESPAFALPSIMVPLTFAWRYQKVNADFLTEKGAAVQLQDEQLSETLLPTVMALLDDPPRLQQMGQAAQRLDKPEAATNLAHLIMALGKG